MAKKKKSLYGSRKKYHYLYKTVNKQTGKFYYGMHSTDNLEDGYKGSGTYLRRAIKKYGVENFEVVIVSYFDTREELALAERTLITEELIQNTDCYNIVQGGSGGNVGKGGKHLGGDSWAAANRFWNTEPGRLLKSEISKKTHISKWEDKEHRERVKKYLTFKGKTHSEETKKKMSESKKITAKGVNNSQFGTCWITDEKESKRIYKGDNIPEGWRLGRVIKSINRVKV